jgi:hypothetical protein
MDYRLHDFLVSQRVPVSCPPVGSMLWNHCVPSQASLLSQASQSSPASQASQLYIETIPCSTVCAFITNYTSLSANSPPALGKKTSANDKGDGEVGSDQLDNIISPSHLTAAHHPPSTQPKLTASNHPLNPRTNAS